MKKLMNKKKQEKELAENLELAASNTKPEVPSAPPDEFSIILREMNRRKIAPKIRKELEPEKKSRKKTPETENDS